MKETWYIIVQVSAVSKIRTKLSKEFIFKLNQTFLSSIDPLHLTTPQAKTAPSVEVNEDLSLAESCALRVKLNTIPLFEQ